MRVPESWSGTLLQKVLIRLGMRSYSGPAFLESYSFFFRDAKRDTQRFLRLAIPKHILCDRAITGSRSRSERGEEHDGFRAKCERCLHEEVRAVSPCYCPRAAKRNCR